MSLIKGFPITTTTTTTTKQNVDPAVHFVYSWVKNNIRESPKRDLSDSDNHQKVI
jgi:hypothetical protein